MSQISIARRYAAALYEDAASRGLLAEVDTDLQFLDASLQASRELGRVFMSPVVSREKKKRIIEQLFGAHVGGETIRFLNLLVDKQREDVLPEISRVFRQLRDARDGVIEAHVRVARPMDSASESALVKNIERMTGKKVRLSSTVDPALIGGVVVRIGDTMYDGSVRQRLKALRQRMEVGNLRAA
jgi:F-type H+-transporting ATPase subunit delta